MLSFLLAASLAATLHPHFILSTDWLADNINHPDVLVLDVSTPDEYKLGHIPGAVAINPMELMVRRNGIPNELPPLPKLETLFRNAGVRDTDRIVITSHDPLLATRLWFTLDYLGYADHASILDGGNAKWRNEQRTWTKAPPNVKTNSNFSPMVNMSVLATLGDVKRVVDAQVTDTIILDARTPNDYMGRSKGAEVDNAGHIPGAICMPWESNTKVEHNARVLLSPRELADVYASLEVASSQQRVIVYCRTGTQATMTYFALRYLGFYPELYDGSFVEWNKTQAVASAEP